MYSMLSYANHAIVASYYMHVSKKLLNIGMVKKLVRLYVFLTMELCHLAAFIVVKCLNHACSHLVYVGTKSYI